MTKHKKASKILALPAENITFFLFSTIAKIIHFCVRQSVCENEIHSIDESKQVENTLQQVFQTIMIIIIKDLLQPSATKVFVSFATQKLYHQINFVQFEGTFGPFAFWPVHVTFDLFFLH